IPVGNIKQIEILRGPATSLYGSDALAGVINIITQQPDADQLHFQAYYGTNNTTGISAFAQKKFEKTAVQFFLKRYSSDGYDFDPDIYGKTIDPFVDYTANGKFVYDINEKTKLSVSARYSTSNQTNKYLIYPNMKAEAVGGNTVESDKSVYARIQHTVNSKINYFGSVYATTYSNNASVFVKATDSLYEHIGLEQFLLKPEIQFNFGEDPAALLVSGVGYNYESINSTRYATFQNLNSWYVFAQKQINIRNKTNIIIGARFDKNQLYPAQLSPKFAIAHKIKSNLIIKGSIGTGFKAPDFRQQFLNFDNSLIGYTIIGARELGNVLQHLKDIGRLDPSTNIDPYLKEVGLVPEKSVGINVGADYTINQKSVIKINFFRNDISNLIESFSLPFKTTDNQGFFSYANVNKVFTTGLEANFSHRLNDNFSLSGGYQYLVAKDKEIVQKIKKGEMYRRDPITNVTTKVKMSEYGGLFNRSRNTANMSLLYKNTRYKMSGFISAKYRGRFGFDGLNGFVNGNSILDDDREYIKGFTLLNANISKLIGKKLEIQGGLENILNYTNKQQMPGIFGRTYFININLNLEK
ncbi:MAG: TonB-dependent receptor, partial [Ginsengibacter sp.]